MADTYQIDVSGHLDSRHAAWLTHFQLRVQPDGTTRLTGPVADQAALFGLLLRLRDLGIPLLRIERLAAQPVKLPMNQVTEKAL